MILYMVLGTAKMIVFTIIIFGLATVRTIVPFTKEETYQTLSKFIATAITTGMMIWCYVWFLQFILSCA